MTKTDHNTSVFVILWQNPRAPASVIIADMAIVSGILFIIAALGTVLASRLTFVGNRKRVKLGNLFGPADPLGRNRRRFNQFY